MGRGTTHIRRCHCCGHISEEKEGKVEKCEQCFKPFAPFFYFDDRFTSVYADFALRPPLMDNEYAPVVGLTVYWEAL